MKLAELKESRRKLVSLRWKAWLFRIFIPTGREILVINESIAAIDARIAELEGK